MKKLSVGVLISGNGSNLQALIEACQSPLFPATIKLVIANKCEAYGLTRAKKANIATAVITHKAFDGRAGFDKAMHAQLQKAGVDFICCAGFMRIISAEFIARWQGRIINIHPSLLPRYKGLNTHQRALAAGENIHGCSVHFVSPELDAGPVIIQSQLPVLSTDTPDTLAGRVLLQEHVIFPMALRLAAEGRLAIADGDVIIDGKRGPIRLDN